MPRADLVAHEPNLVSLRAVHLESIASGVMDPESAAMQAEELSWRTVSEPEDEPPQPTLNVMVLTLLDALPLEEAYILRQSFMGTSQRQIAEALGIQQPSVCNRLSIAMERMRAAAQGRDPVLPPGFSVRRKSFRVGKSKMKAPWLRDVSAPVVPATVLSIDGLRGEAECATSRARGAWEVMLDAARERAAKLRESMANQIQGDRWTPRKAAKELLSLNPNRRKRARKVIRAAGGQAK